MGLSLVCLICQLGSTVLLSCLWLIKNLPYYLFSHHGYLCRNFLLLFFRKKYWNIECKTSIKRNGRFVLLFCNVLGVMQVTPHLLIVNSSRFMHFILCATSLLLVLIMSLRQYSLCDWSICRSVLKLRSFCFA